MPRKQKAVRGQDAPPVGGTPKRPGGRPSVPRPPTEVSEIWLKFFDGVLSACPEVLDALREKALEPFKKLSGSERAALFFGLSPQTSKFFNPTLDSWQRQFLRPWAEQFNLLPYTDQVYPIALQDLLTLIHSPNHGHKGLWWHNKPATVPNDLAGDMQAEDLAAYVNDVIQTGSGVKTVVYLPPVDRLSDKTFEAYRVRVLKDAQDGEVRDSLLRAAQSAWDAASAEKSRCDTDPSYVPMPRRRKDVEDKHFEAAALSICLKRSFRMLAEVFHQDESVISRWVKGVRELLNESAQQHR